MISIRTSERNGKVVTARLVKQLDEIMLISNKGVLTRTRVKEIRKMARATQGVKLMNLDVGTKLVGLEIVDGTDED
jgi:DNA gyrase subunit A